MLGCKIVAPIWLPLLGLNTTTTLASSLARSQSDLPISSLHSECGFGGKPQAKGKQKRSPFGLRFCFELVGQNCNSIKSRILCLRFINIEIIPLNTVLVNRFLKSFCKIIETMSYYFLYLMYKYRLKRGKPILSLSSLCCFYFS